MQAFDTVDLSLFGTFETCSSAGVSTHDTMIDADAEWVLLELKSADAAIGAEELRLLLNEMTREMRAQFMAFRDLRTAAEDLATEGDDAAQKLARADLKAATDAMGLIVRTLEKVDALQRQLARDRAEEAERQAMDTGFEEALHNVQTLIEARAQDLYRRWKRDEAELETDCDTDGVRGAGNGGGKRSGATGQGPPPPSSAGEGG